MSIQEEDTNVQLTKKHISDEIRQLRTELEQAHTTHTIAKYTNAQHATRLEMALELKHEMSQSQPQASSTL